MLNTESPVKKTRLSYLLPELLLNDVKEKMVLQGYDLKGKSKWISEAIFELLSIQNYCDLIKISEQMNDFEKLDFISIDQGLKLKIDEAVIEVRKKFPSMEGVQSKILRTAIIQRLLK